MESSPEEQPSYARAQRNLAGSWDVILRRKGESQKVERYATKFEAVKVITEFERMEIQIASSRPSPLLNSGLSSGIKGVHRSGDKWVAQCFKDGAWHYLGRHISKKEAAEAIVSFEGCNTSNEMAPPPPAISLNTTVWMPETANTASSKMFKLSSYPPPRTFAKPPVHAVILTGKRGRPAKLINRPAVSGGVNGFHLSQPAIYTASGIY
jgi:hypothetical protein